MGGFSELIANISELSTLGTFSRATPIVAELRVEELKSANHLVRMFWTIVLNQQVSNTSHLERPADPTQFQTLAAKCCQRVSDSSGVNGPGR